GSILVGAVHDYTALVLSAQHQGESVPAITESALGKSARIIFSLFVFLTLILIVAVFAAVAGKTLAVTPEVVLPTFGLIVVAVIVGFLIYRVRLNMFLCSAIGLALLFALIIAGFKFPISLPIEAATPAEAQAIAAKWWTVILLVYGLVASVTPVTILLQPRDHLAAGVLFFGMVIGFGGVLVSRPAIHAPAVVQFDSSKGWLWPMLFVTVACGAVSGFHSLVASGTSSKQLPTMKDARPVGYGAMIMESGLSILAVLAVTAGLFWKAPPAGMSGPVYQEVFSSGGWIKAFGVGYGNLTGELLSALRLDGLVTMLGVEKAGTGAALGMLLGITMLKTFVMTTLDSATRITRYITGELFGDTLGIRLLKNKYVATLLVGVLAGALALGNWKAIWPVFGSSNQLIASLVLIVASVYLLQRGRRFWFVAIPGALMLVTTMAALVYQSYTFLTADEPEILLAVVAIVLMALGLVVLFQGIAALRRARDGQRTVGTAPSGAE
ncbi:MAG: carbon starvation protein A, partial [Deltaproteobacteria bacterium]|nr:carbon starvation protein A [Deltaproteobacteria bacterium]